MQKRLHRSNITRKRDQWWLRRVQTSASGATPSVFTKGFNYRPLRSDRKEIRVLRFDNWWKPSFRRLRFKVETLSLSHDTHEPYYAISYAWGENPDLAPVVLDGQEAQIPDSAEEALRGVLRSIGKHRRLRATLIWIDAVCINQEDLEEKSQQVAFMGTIFAQADLVFAWLGPDNGTMKAASRSFRALQQQFHDLTDEEHDIGFLERLGIYEKSTMPCLLVPPPRKFNSNAFRYFIRCRYFTRLWIMQEIAVAKRVVFLRGETRIPWDIFVDAMRWISVHNEVTWFGHGLDGGSHIRAIKVLIDTRNSMSLDGPRNSLFQHVLALSWLFQTSNAWDKIYALLHCLFQRLPSSERSWVSDIVPDYEKPLRTVYQEASSLAMKLANSVRLLEFAAIFTPWLEELPDWPSWVPRYHEMDWDDFDSSIVVHGSVSHGVQPSFRFDEGNPKLLKVKGLLVGVVAGSLSLTQSANSVLLNWLNEIRPRRIQVDESMLRTTAIVLVEGEYKDMNAEDSEDLLSDFVAFILRNKEFCHEQTQSTMEQITAGVATKAGDADRFEEEYVRAQRVLFQTVDGRLGVTNTRPETGDCICILFGCKETFVLRRVNTDWRIKGTAYVPDITKGEYVQNLQAECRLGQETVTFSIC